MAVLVLVYAAACIALYDQLVLFLHAPVLMSIASQPTPLWDLPFPAVTICSENQVRPSYFNYSDFLLRTGALTSNESEIFDYLSITCQHNFSKSNEELFSNDVINHIHDEIWNHCEETFYMQWMSRNVHRPCDMMQRVLTPHGACQTFNSLPGDLLYRPEVVLLLHEHTRHVNSSKEGVVWSPDWGYRDARESLSPPWRASGGGLGQGALFIMDLNYKDFDNTCFFGGRGFMMTLHSPAELPSASHPSTYVAVDHFAQVKVTPQVKVTDKTLRRWSPKDRGCFFEDERPLLFFKYYTEKNCDLECESNVSLSLCGCVPFFHPRTKSTPVCRLKKLECYLNSIGKKERDSNNKIKSIVILDSYKKETVTDMIAPHFRVETKAMDPDTTITNSCDCMPSCSEIEYSISVTSFPRNFSVGMVKGLQKENLRYKGIPENNYAAALIAYQTQKATAMMRVAVFGLSDFVANMGGLLGLFLGFSFISLFELCYFCTLRFRRKKPRKINVCN